MKNEKFLSFVSLVRFFRADKVENRFDEKQHFVCCELKKSLERNFKAAVKPLSKARSPKILDFISHEFSTYRLCLVLRVTVLSRL